MKRREYTGSIPELRGKTALVRPICEADQKTFLAPLPMTTVMAQFDNPVIFNGVDLSRKWSPFTPNQFTVIGEKPVF